MISYAYARTYAYVYLQTDIRIFGQISIRIVYNEPNAVCPSYLIKTRKAHFNDASLFYYRLLHLFTLRDIIRTFSVRISKPCMDGVRFMAF